MLVSTVYWKIRRERKGLKLIKLRELRKGVVEKQLETTVVSETSQPAEHLMAMKLIVRRSVQHIRGNRKHKQRKQ